MTRGDKHVVTIEKEGRRPITLPLHRGKSYGKGLTAPILRQAGLDMTEREYRVLVHEEDGAYWAEVEDLPGCFASGHDLDELRNAVVEAITLYLSKGPADEPRAAATAHVDEMRVLVSA